MDERPQTRSQEHVIEIAAPPEAVWKALTEAEEIVRWFAPEAKVSPGQGGSIWVSFGPGMEGTSLIEAWEPGRHLRLVDLRDGASACGPTEPFYPGTQVPVRLVVDYHLEAKGGGTVLRLVQSGFGVGASWDSDYDSTVRGWPLFLRTLRQALERHAGKGANQAYVSVPFQVPITEAWQALTGPVGFQGAAGPLAKGSRWSLGIEGEAGYSGMVEILAPPASADASYAELAGTLAELDEALFWVTLADSRGQKLAGAMIIAHGVGAEAVERVRLDLEARFQALLSAADPVR